MLWQRGHTIEGSTTTAQKRRVPSGLNPGLTVVAIMWGPPCYHSLIDTKSNVILRSAVNDMLGKYFSGISPDGIKIASNFPSFIRPRRGRKQINQETQGGMLKQPQGIVVIGFPGFVGF